MKIYTTIHFLGGKVGAGNIIAWNSFRNFKIKNTEKEKKNLIFMQHIVYNLGMKLAHHKNGLCRRNIFGENKTVKYDVHVEAKKKVFVYCCSIKYVKCKE